MPGDELEPRTLIRLAALRDACLDPLPHARPGFDALVTSLADLTVAD
jgi:hypothetical protein